MEGFILGIPSCIEYRNTDQLISRSGSGGIFFGMADRLLVGWIVMALAGIVHLAAQHNYHTAGGPLTSQS